jgi:hypothetical protein
MGTDKPVLTIIRHRVNDQEDDDVCQRLSARNNRGNLPPDVFENDAGLNSTADVVILHGVFIGSAPNEQGQFRIARATRQVGEAQDQSGSLFLPPYMGRAYGAFSFQGGSKGAVIENCDIMEPHPEEYIAFIDELIRAALDLCAPTAQSDVGSGGDPFRGLRGG